MSDTEGTKKSGYRLEYASSNRAKCKGPKPCQGTAIAKGELKFGSLVDFKGNTSFAWRHWGCVTEKILTNAKNSFEEADELDGFEELNEDDQEKIRKAWEEGHVAEEDVPESAKKAAGDDEESDGEEAKPKKRAAAKASKKKDDGEPMKTVFKLEYASSGRSKCKDCGETIGKDFFRLGNEANFRGNTSFAWHHWGCTPDSMIASLKVSYNSPSDIEGFVDLKEAEKEKVQHAWEEGAIPEDDKGIGEAVDTGKKKPAPRKKKDANGDEAEKPKRSRAKKAPKDDDDEEEEEKPKKRAAAKPAAEKKTRAPAKKRASKRKDESEDGEDFGDEIAAVEDDEDEEELEEEENPKKRKRAPASKGTSSKPPSKRAKPASSRGKKKQEEAVPEESEPEDD